VRGKRTFSDWKGCTRSALWVLIVALGATECSTFCDNQVVNTVPSPDGKHKAVLFWRDCGATAWGGDVSIIDARDDLPNRAGNILRLGGAWVAASRPGNRGSVLRVEVTWESSAAVLIKYDPRAEVYKRETFRDGVSVVYRPITP